VKSGIWPLVRNVLWVLPVALIAYSISKGAIDVVQDWGKVNWYASYDDGFMRRGLMGTIFQGMFGNLPEAEYTKVIVDQHTFFVVALAGLTIGGLFFAAQKSQRPLAILIAACVLAAGQVWSHLAYVVGYLDPQVLMVVALATGAIAMGRSSVGALIAAIGPLIHEQFLFYWGPVAAAQALLVLGSKSNGRDRTQEFPELQFVLLIAPMLVTTALVMFMHSDESARAAVAATPVGPEVKDGLLRQHFGQTVSSATSYMFLLWSRNFDSGVMALVVYSGPVLILSLLTLAAFPNARNRRAIIGALVIGSLGCLSILLLAWDLSRFASMATIMWAAITVLIAARAENPATVAAEPEADEEPVVEPQPTPVSVAMPGPGAAPVLGLRPTGTRVVSQAVERRPVRELSPAIAYAAMAAGLFATVIGAGAPLVFSYFDIFFVLRGPHQVGPVSPLGPTIEHILEPVYPPRPI